jgi:hypothetical protein
MGVMLSLEGTREQGRKRSGQHHGPEDQAFLDALAALLRSDAPSAVRSLSKIPRSSLAARLLPAARALVRGAGDLLEQPARAAGPVAEARRVSSGELRRPLTYSQGMARSSMYGEGTSRRSA